MQQNFSPFHLNTPVINPHHSESSQFGGNCGFNKMFLMKVIWQNLAIWMVHPGSVPSFWYFLATRKQSQLLRKDRVEQLEAEAFTQMN